MLSRKKVIVFTAINATILIYCSYLYLQGYEFWRLAVVSVVSVAGLNLIATFAWRSATKKNGQHGATRS
jgi:hypothetical protein